MRQFVLVAAGVVAVLFLIALSGATYIVTETEQVVLTQFGSPVALRRGPWE